MKTLLTILLFFAGVACASAQLSVAISPIRVSGQKAIVPLALTNGLAEKVESARAAIFLLDEQGKVVGQSAQWVIGGSNTNGLAAGVTNAFHFTITSDRPFSTTNLTAKVRFTRVLLEGGKVADVTKAVKIEIRPR